MVPQIKSEVELIPSHSPDLHNHYTIYTRNLSWFIDVYRCVSIRGLAILRAQPAGGLCQPFWSVRKLILISREDDEDDEDGWESHPSQPSQPNTRNEGQL